MLPIWQEVENLVRIAAGSDLEGKSCYIVNGAELPAECNQPDLGGFTCGYLDLALAPWLAAQGRWRGRGFACVIYPDRFPTSSYLIGCAIHEVAHYLDSIAVRTMLAPSGSAASADYIPAGDLAAMAFADWPTLSHPWDGHGPGFIRAGMHLAYRLSQLPTWGYFGADFAALAGEFYGLSSCFAYCDALGDERHERIDEPISAILTTPAPAEFSDLFRRDVAAWHKQNPRNV